MKIENKQVLNDKLINHYDCFNRERFYLDVFDNQQGYISIVTISISDTCPFKLCKGIAKYISKLIKKADFDYIYVGAWNFKVTNL